MPNQNDPYVYPGTSTLINKFNITDPEKLQELEGLCFLSKKASPLPSGNLDYDHLKAIHHHFFHDIYEWAGQERSIDIAKDNSYFCHAQYISKELDKLFLKLKAENYLRELPLNDFCKKLSFYFNEINAAHPFREGNGRTQRAFCDVLAKQAGYSLDWTKVNAEKYMQASIAGFLHGNYEALELILENITTPLHYSHEKNEIITLEENAKHLLNEYIAKQLELTNSIKQKTQLLSIDPDKSKEVGKNILLMNDALKQIAKKLIDSPFCKPLLDQAQPIILQKSDVFLKMNERLQKNIMTTSDVVSILRHAKTIVLTSQTFNQKNNRSR